MRGTMTMSDDELEVIEEPIRAVVVSQPGQVIVTDNVSAGPTDMLERATVIATALAKMVDAQKLYSEIRGKKYPQVEAWQTIGRMDNVVAREASRPIQHEDGSWEAEVELVRLSDGMVIGNGSALCGAKGDNPWDSRPAHQRRSMAVTRATSRAFRQQYSWIMALAGYEPTPADEMPDERGETHGPKPYEEHLLGEVSRSGKIALGTAAGYKLEAREAPDGWSIGFRLNVGKDKNIPQVLATGPLGAALYAAVGQDPSTLKGTAATVHGLLYQVTLPEPREPTYRLVLSKIETEEWVIPAEKYEAEHVPPVAPGQELLPLDEDERAAIAGEPR